MGVAHGSHMTKLCLPYRVVLETDPGVILQRIAIKVVRGVS